ncbi:MAG: methylamine utilization protein MauJ [Sphingopyxis terrae]|uniref:methylamine utilization protein MauJ n=1 Tax=Sphingopyxis terrae TaxID=33052 RepID=UPI003F7DBD3C
MRDEMGMPLSMEIQPRAAMLEAEPALRQIGQWVCLNIEPTFPWPVRPQSVEFSGHTLWLIPITQEDHPGVAIRRPLDMAQEDAESLLYRFLSVVAWREDAGIVVAHRTGGSRPHMMGLNRKIGFAVRDSFDFTDLISPEEEGPRIALALMREARSLNHYGYAFLSYWRVLELAFPKTRARVEWMEATLPTLDGRGIREARESIASQAVENICSHLFESGRCAIAHATGKPVINPDDPRDALRLYRELPLVREMAVRAVEERFGIPTRSTEYSQHLYELRGWKEILGERLLSEVANANVVERPEGEKVDLPLIHVRLHSTPPYKPFENMVPKSIEQQGNELLLVYATEDHLMEVCFRLAPAEERLKFDIFNGVYGRDDGSVAAAEYKWESLRFFRDYMLNGVLQMWNAETGSLISRLDAYIPVNMMFDLKVSNDQIAAARTEVERRELSPGPESGSR